MDYEFKNIESLISNAIQSFQKSKRSLQDEYATLRKSVAGEIAIRKNSFLHHGWALEKGLHRANYVQFHQHCLIKFINELFSFSEAERRKNKSNLTSEVFFLYNQMEDILEFIRTEFETEFDDNATIPESKKVATLKSLERLYSQIKFFLDNEDLDYDLSHLVKQFIQTSIGEKTSKVTYGQINYLETLIQAISDITDLKQSTEMTDELKSCLISINFNCPEFFRYYINTIQSEVSSIEFGNDQIERLSYHLKKVNQSQPRPNIFYNLRQTSIKERLSDWLLEEIQFIDKKCKLTNANRDKGDDFLKRDFKLEFDMSVSQFAFFTKTLVEAGVIQNKNISELIRFLSRFVKTKRSESISHESLRIKYYNVESGTKQSVRSLFHTAISYINSN